MVRLRRARSQGISNLSGFNSTMVRLKDELRKEYVVSFNSTMVRLKAQNRWTTVIHKTGFNSTMVRLKEWCRPQFTLYVFQFHNGSIKRRACNIADLPKRLKTWTTGFNSTMVRLKLEINWTCFNSTMVRLKEQGFNSMVRLKENCLT